MSTHTDTKIRSNVAALLLRLLDEEEENTYEAARELEQAQERRDACKRRVDALRKAVEVLSEGGAA